MKKVQVTAQKIQYKTNLLHGQIYLNQSLKSGINLLISSISRSCISAYWTEFGVMAKCGSERSKKNNMAVQASNLYAVFLFNTPCFLIRSSGTGLTHRLHLVLYSFTTSLAKNVNVLFFLFANESPNFIQKNFFHHP